MNKNISISILTPPYIAFCKQGASLAAGFKKLNYIGKETFKVNLVTAAKGERENYRKCTGDFVIGIGSWRDWPWIYENPKKLGKKVFPWLVSDEKVLRYIKEINRVPVLFVTSNFCKRTFEKAGIKKEIIQIIPEGIDTNFWRPAPEKEVEKIRSFLGLRQNEKSMTLLTIGGDGTSKGVQEVLLALGKIPLLNVLYIIKTRPGNVAFCEGLKELNLIERLDLKDKVRQIIGYFSDEFIKSLINICDVYIGPSHCEGFGLPHIQAMACGKPVITCWGIAAEETSLNGITGYIVSSSPMNKKDAEGYAVKGVKADIEELKEAVKNLVENRKLREAMGRKARKHIVKNYECKKIAQIFLEKLKQFV